MINAIIGFIASINAIIASLSKLITSWNFPSERLMTSCASPDWRKPAQIVVDIARVSGVLLAIAGLISFCISGLVAAIYASGVEEAEPLTTIMRIYFIVISEFMVGSFVTLSVAEWSASRWLSRH